jgi:lysyl-tRNA synthetase class 2
MPTVAPWWRPDIFARRRPMLELRGRLTAATRAFFAARDFLEVETPALQVSPGLEPHLMAFATELVAADQQSSQPLYLHTSPEFAMKKLLAAGLPRIFQLAHVFRNGERASTHHPEFTMLEWYRTGSYGEIIADTAELLRALAAVAGRAEVAWRGLICDLNAQPELLTVQDAFARHAGAIDLLATVGDMAALIAEAGRIGVRVGAGDRWDDLVLRILAERVELYIAGVEIANGFGELTDAAEQRRRFTADMDLKEQLYGTRYPIDAEFLAALEYGIPDSAGMALGFDRLVMLLAGAEHIEDVLWVPVAG